MTVTDDIEIVEETTAPPPPGAPREFRELLALALRTTDESALDQAERDYRGVHASVHDYLMSEILGHLPPDLDWLPAVCDPDQLRLAYQARVARSLWTIRLADGRVMVFESARR